MTGPDAAPQTLGDRQKEILTILNQGEYNAQEIAERTNITASTVKDHISTLRQHGYQIHSSHNNQRGYVLESDFGEDYDAIVNDLQTGVTYDDLNDKYDLTEQSARRVLDKLRERGHTIDHKEVDADGTRLYYIPEETDKPHRIGQGDGRYRFALISDTHLGSTVEHLNDLHDFYDRLQAEGVTHVFHGGDIGEGWEIHPGHVNVIKGEASGWGRLKEYMVENYPQRDDIQTHFIEGNHDNRYYNNNSIHWGELVANERDDLTYCGDSQARFIFDRRVYTDAQGTEHVEDIDLELIHPSGGKPYTPGYRLLTLYRERPPEERPTIAGVAHLHGKLYTAAAGVPHGFYTGCWKGLTTYGKRRGHDAQIGGWIIEMTIEGGQVREFVPKWVGYESTMNPNPREVNDLPEL